MRSQTLGLMRSRDFGVKRKEHFIQKEEKGEDTEGGEISEHGRPSGPKKNLKALVKEQKAAKGKKQ